MRSECPAEIIIERQESKRRLACYEYVWSVCQPDQCWGEWIGGVCETYEEAARLAQKHQNIIHFKQGVL